MAVQADIIFATLDPIDGQPVDEVGIGRAADPRRQRDPGLQRLRAPGEPADRALDPGAGLAVEPVGRVLEHRLQPLAERDQRADQPLQRLDRGRGRLDQSRIGLGQLGLQPVARILRGGAGIDGRAHRREQTPRPGRTARPPRSGRASRRRAARPACWTAPSSASAPASS